MKIFVEIILPILADILLVFALEHISAVLSGDFGGIIGAVVRDNVHINILGRVGLFAYAVKQIADYCFFVSCGYHNRKTVELIGFRVLFRLFYQRYEYIKELIRIANDKKHADEHINNVEQIEKIHY